MSRRGVLRFPLLLAIIWAGAAPAVRAAEAPPATQPTAVRVAALLPLSGPLAPLGESARRGIDLAVARIQRDGGLAGMTVAVSFADTQARAAKPDVQATSAIVNDRVDALIGGVEGPVAVTVRTIAEKRRTVFLALNESARLAPDGGRFTVRVGASGAQLADAIAAFARDTLKASRAAASADLNAEPSAYLADRFAERFIRAGGQIARIDALNAGGARDPVAAAAELGAKASQANPDVLFTALSGEGLVAYVEAFRKKLPAAPTLLAPLPWTLPGLLGPAAEPLRPAFVAVPFAADDPEPRVRAFLDDWAKAFPDAQPDSTAATAHDSVLLLAEAVRSREASGGELRDRLAAVRNLPGVQGAMTVGEGGEIVRPIAICKLAPAADDARGNRLVFVRRVTPGLPAAATQAEAHSK